MLFRSIDGFLYSFAVSDENKLPYDIKDFFLKENGKMKIMGRIIFDDKILLEKVKTGYDYFDETISDK